MRSGRNYVQRQSETLESSFELEEPEDYEQEDSEVEQVNSAGVKAELSATGNRDRDRDRQESGEQTDTLSTHSSSSTPTTADVADVETISSLPLSPPAFGGRGSQLVKRHSPLKDQQLADSSSTSSSSQQPDVDDDVPTVSGCDLGHNAPSNSASSSSSSSSSSTTPQTSRYAAAAAHPSAAFAETAVTSSSGSARVTGGAAHRRTHSAASYISMRSQGGNSEAPPERPKRNRFFEWLRVVCNICCCKVFTKTGDHIRVLC